MSDRDLIKALEQRVADLEAVLLNSNILGHQMRVQVARRAMADAHKQADELAQSLRPTQEDMERRMTI